MNGALNLHPKVSAGLIAGYVMVIIVYCLHQYANTDLPDTVSAAIVGLVTFIAAWLAPTLVTEDPAAAAAAPDVPPAA